MGAGRFRHRVIFRQAAEAVDEYGNVVGAFSDKLKVWGNVRETTGKERVLSGVIENVRTATIRIRASCEALELTESDQVLARGEVWDILGIAHADDKGAVLDILVQAGSES